MAVVVEITPNAATPVLDHCDQLEGILPRGVELNVSVNQGEAEGAVRASKISRRGTMREADFRFMTGLVLGAGTLSRRTKFALYLTGRKGGRHIRNRPTRNKAK